MAKIHRSQNNFTAGQLGELMQQRYEFPKYLNAVKRMENFVIESQGPITRRPGTRFVNSINTAGTDVRLKEFIFNSDQVFVLEFTPLKVRFYTNNAVVQKSGVDFTVTTPYVASELYELDFAQAADTLFITHRNHPPAELVRFATDDWVYSPIVFDPEPTQESGLQPTGASLTLNATSGLGRTATASAGSFLVSDEGRTISEVDGPGFATITDAVAATVATIDILEPFSSLTFAEGEWIINGSPLDDIKPDITGPVGAKVTLNAISQEPRGTELVVNGDFSSGSTNWTAPSVTAVASGTHDGGTTTDFLVDSSEDFEEDGVRPGYIIRNTTTNAEAGVGSIRPPNVSTTIELSPKLTGGSRQDFQNGDTFEIFDTSTVAFTATGTTLLGGEQGTAWLQQNVPTSVDESYRLQFIVRDGPLSVQIGSETQTSDIVAEATYEIGEEHEIIFTAKGPATFIQFRNNQNVPSRLVFASMRLFSGSAFRTTDVGKTIKLSNGIVEITQHVSDAQVCGVIKKTLDDTNQVLGGAWTLEDPVWSATKGYPGVVTFFEQRLFIASTDTFPLDVWFSRVGNFVNFAAGTNDDDSGRFTVASQEVNQILWMTSDNEVILATEREPFVATGGSTSTITPTNIIIRSVSRDTIDIAEPRRVGNALLFLQGGATVMRELLFNDNVGERESADLTILADDITESGIKQFSYQQTPRTTIWAVRNDGTLLSAAYLRRQDVIGWATHPTQGTVLSVAVVPGPNNEDQVWIAVRRENQTFIEYLDTSGGFYSSLTLDSALSYDGVATTTLSGLQHLSNRTVQVLGDGANLGEFTVGGNGEITNLPIEVTRADVGLSYTSTVETLRPPLFGGGGPIPSIGFPIYAHRVVVRLLSSLGLILHLAENNQQEIVPFRTPADNMGSVPPLFTGDKVIDGGINRGGFDSEGTVVVKQEIPLPCTIQSITVFGSTGDI